MKKNSSLFNDSIFVEILNSLQDFQEKIDEKQSFDSFSQEDLNMWNVVSPSTSNALVATFVYMLQYEKRICKLNVNGECFKGKHCKLQRVPKI